MSLAARDKNVIWHPFTQHQSTSFPVPITSASGAYLIDEKGYRYLDLISSWWVNLHGHGHPIIAKAIYEQAMQLEHVIFAGFTHEPAIRLAEELIKILPNGFGKIFYSDNGSTAVEIALKLAYQYWKNLGESQRKRFIAFKSGYHGDTFGAMAVGKQSGFFSAFEDLLFHVDTFAYPAIWLNDPMQLQKEDLVLIEISQFLEKYGHETAAMIIEPLVQGAGGMQMCSTRFLKNLETLVRSYGVLIVYDEVMTGFCRTGDYFACLKSQTTPDIICMAKGITGGFLPLAVTACQDFIYKSFLGETFVNAFAHGHSYTANPLGCAAALASLALLQQTETQHQIKMIEKVHSEELSKLYNSDVINALRYCGTIAAFNLVMTTNYGSDRSNHLKEKFHQRGLIIRPLGQVIYMLPPYCVTEDELRNAYVIVMEELEGVKA